MKAGDSLKFHQPTQYKQHFNVTSCSLHLPCVEESMPVSRIIRECRYICVITKKNHQKNQLHPEGLIIARVIYRTCIEVVLLYSE